MFIPNNLKVKLILSKKACLKPSKFSSDVRGHPLCPTLSLSTFISSVVHKPVKDFVNT